MKGLKGKTALITGAARGIGRAIALRLAAEGANVAVGDINLEGAETTAREAAQSGVKAIALKLDVTRAEEAAVAVARVQQELGALDILVNNAGWDHTEPFADSTAETWDKVIAINYRGVLNCCKAAIPALKGRPAARIVSIASDAGRVGSSGEAGSSGCKGAVIAFSKTLARELARERVNVNVVCPGLTDTALLRDAMAGREKLLESITRSIPLRRIGQPEEVAAAVAFFASADADYITGQVLSVSGGLTMAG
ncbi:MAG: glucose 1-dehydrogenase [Deltaproteobacteria bacterium]|nr:glucose 1-dehydrogenase [Deltaproteobacteria bacterium]